jgi:hypothetical protein
MSRGLGVVEHQVLQVLEASPAPYLWLTTLRETLCPTPDPLPNPTRPFTLERVEWAMGEYLRGLPVKARHEAINRAVRSLTRKGLVCTGMAHYGTGHPHEKAVWLSSRSGPPSETVYAIHKQHIAE